MSNRECVVCQKGAGWWPGTELIKYNASPHPILKEWHHAKCQGLPCEMFYVAPKVDRTGLEPATPTLPAWCSPN
jgi:hypothetical protein